MAWVAVGVGIVSAGVSIYKGVKQKNEAKKQLAALNGKEIPAEALENQKLARDMANQGLPSEQYALAKKNIDRQNALAITASQNRRAGLGLIGKIQQGTNDAYGRLDAQNAAMKVANTGRLMNVNNQIANFRNQKYQGDYNYAMSLKGAGNQNIDNGIDTGISAIGNGFSGYMKQKNNNRGLYGGSGYSGGITSYSGGID